MAEALPDGQSESELLSHSRRIILVLLLGTRWQFDTYGLSTFNKSLVNNLRLVDPEGRMIRITCAVLQDDGKIRDEDLKDARKLGVELKEAKRPRGSKKGRNQNCSGWIRVQELIITIWYKIRAMILSLDTHLTWQTDALIWKVSPQTRKNLLKSSWCSMDSPRMKI